MDSVIETVTIVTCFRRLATLGWPGIKMFPASRVGREREPPLYELSDLLHNLTSLQAPQIRDRDLLRLD